MKPAGEGGADDDDELGGMRSVWRAMRDEEPSARGLDALMAAAGAKAAEMKPPPALAAGTRPPDDESRPVAKASAVVVPPVAKRRAWRAPVLAFASAVVIAGGVWAMARQDAAAPSPEQTAPVEERLQVGGAPRAAPADAAPTPDAPTPAPKSPNAALLREAEAAAERGDCAQARKLIARIFHSEAGPRARALPPALARCMAE